jgi:hypothetical protein
MTRKSIPSSTKHNPSGEKEVLSPKFLIPKNIEDDPNEMGGCQNSLKI